MKYYEIKRFSVLPRKYSSTVKGVLQYFQGSTRVCQNTYPLFYDKAPTFPSRGFVIT